MNKTKNIAEQKKELIEKYGEEGAVKALRQDAKELLAIIEDVGKEIESAYDKYALASAAATCGTVVITWLGDEVMSRCIAGNKRAIELIAKIAQKDIEELLSE